MKRLVKTYIFLLLLLVSCFSQKDTDNRSDVDVMPKQVVLIFENFPSDYSIPLNDTQGKAYTPARPEIRYYDENLIQRVVKPKGETSDTVVIKFKQKTLEIQHSVKAVDNFEYVFNWGDTVVFTYTNKIPTARVINRGATDYEINYDLNQRTLICNNDYPATVKLVMPFMFITYNATHVSIDSGRPGILGQIDKVTNEAKTQVKLEFDKEVKLLDSLFENGIISKETASRLKQRLNLRILAAKVYNNELSYPAVDSILKTYSDTLLRVHSFRNLLSTVSSSFYERRLNRIYKTNSNLPDYNLVYDSIIMSGLFNAEAKKVLLFETSDNLIKNSSASQIARHIEKLEGDIKDTLMISYLENKYTLSKPVSNELDLVSLDGQSKTLADIVSENSGKVIYVDFWASWCSPCIAEFPASRALAQKMSGRDFTMLYLSIDEDKLKWNNANSKYSLPKTNSYLIVNKSTSKFLENLEFNTIPRYVIFNKSGELIHKNAPRPGDISIMKILEKASED